MIDRALNGLFKTVAEEAAGNPAFARRLEDSLAKFAEDFVERRRAEKRVGDFHPFIALKKEGETNFRVLLAQFDAAELRLIVTRHNLDAANTLKPKASKKALIELIVAAASKRLERDARLFEY